MTQSQAADSDTFDRPPWWAKVSVKAMFRTLGIRFEDRDKFAREYSRNLANGGMFIPTDEQFDLREVVEIDLHLVFCERTVTLQAEIVTHVGAELQEAGGQPGVAVQFLVPAGELRSLLGDIAGIAPPGPLPVPWPERDGPARIAERVRASLVAFVESRDGNNRGFSRDLSKTGVLIATDSHPATVGESVSVTLVHPGNGTKLEVNARVARHLTSNGRVAAMGLQFQIAPEEQEEIEGTLEELRAAAHAQQLAGIRGSIATLGLANLLQMFASSTDAGTLLVCSDDEEGRIIFESGVLRNVAVGPVVGMKALTRILSWETGEFWLIPWVAPDEPQPEEIPIYSAVLEGVTNVDELKRLDLSVFPLDSRLVRVNEIEADAELDKVAAQVLELAFLRATVGSVLEAISELDVVIYQAMADLVDSGHISTSAG